MLPAASRLRRRPDFTAAMRRGRRAGRGRLVVHLADPDPDADQSVRAGFVVGRNVGGAVVRNRVRRQLQHLVADRLPTLPAGSRLVVRVLPPAAGSSSAELGADLDAALTRVTRRPT
ncbi:MAG TPA: ribonuclease P protein component [Acidothermaceae bacterium]|nr:ribonuclease P protein component [Acidothermaceae bacterium]